MGMQQYKLWNRWTSESPTHPLSTLKLQLLNPDLRVALQVVSGGRALKDTKKLASTLYPSRSAVDAGYADNSLQVE